VTCRDSGGPTELVSDGVNGVVCAPTAPALALGLSRVMHDRDAAERLGAAGRIRGAALTWSATVARLLDRSPGTPV